MGVEVEDVTLVFKIGTILLLVSILFQVVGMGSSHWVLTIRDDLGVIEYNGLWDKCSDLAVGTGQFKCSAFVWEDVQVSHWFRTVQTMEVLGLVGLLSAVVMIILYVFVSHTRGKAYIRVIALCLCYLCGTFIIVSAIVFGSLKKVQKSRHVPDSYVKLSWSFAVSLIGGILGFFSGIAFTASH